MKSLALLGLILILPSIAIAEPPTEASAPQAADAERARLFLKRHHGAVTKTLRQGAASKAKASTTRSKLQTAIAELLDFDELSKRSLGDHWDKLQPAARGEFVSLLTQLVERSYQANLKSTANFTVKYGSAETRGHDILVKTLARSLKNRRAPSIAIDYAMHASGNTFRVHDVTTDGVSLVANYRRQFSKIIRRHGWEELLIRMRKRLADQGGSF